jgi:hypothetical protein
MNLLKTLFGGSVRVKLFVQTEYLKAFLEKIVVADITDIVSHKTTEAEAKLVGIKNHAHYTTVIVTVSNRKRDILAQTKRAFDEFLAQEKQRKLEEAMASKLKPKKKGKISRPTAAAKVRRNTEINIKRGVKDNTRFRV